MKQSITVVCILFLAVGTASGAPRAITRQTQPVPQKIVYIPVVNYDPNQIVSQEDEDNRVFINNIASIAGHFGNIITAPHNTPLVVSNVGNMLQGMANIAAQLFKTSYRGNRYQQIRDPKLRSQLVALLLAQSEIIRSGRRTKMMA